MLHGPIRRGGDLVGLGSGLATYNPGGCFEEPRDSSSKVCLEDIHVNTVNSNISQKEGACLHNQVESMAFCQKLHFLLSSRASYSTQSSN